MRLAKIKLESFRNHTSSTLDLGDSTLVYIKGSNFSGKSSISQAISMALTPSTIGLDTQGRGFSSKIKREATKAVITLNVQGKHLIQQVVTLNLNTSGRTQRATCLDDPEWHPAPFEKFLERYKDALRVALNTDAFLLLEEKEQKNLLAKLALPDRYDFPEDKIAEVGKSIGAGVIDFSGEPFSVIEKAYKKLYDERTVTNRQVKEFVIPESLPFVIDKQEKKVDTESLQMQLETIREQRKKLQTERDAAVSRANDVEVKRATLQTKIENLRAERDKGQTKLTSLETSILSAEDVKKFTEVSAKAEELTKLKQQHSGFLGGKRMVDEQIDRLKGISGKGATCPTCDQEIDNVRIKILVADWEKEVTDVDAKLQELDKHIKAIGDVESAKESLKKHNSAVREKGEVETSLIEIVKKGKAATAELKALGEKEDATLAFTDPLADLQVKEDKINEQLRPVIAADERKKEIGRLTEQKSKLETKASTLDKLVEYFGKDGIKAKLLAEHIGGFQNKMNEVMEAWGYKTTLSIEPYQFEVTDTHGVTTPVKELSGSEQLMFSVALQCAVSRAAGVGLVVADRMDTFLPAQRQKAITCLHEATQDEILEQCILIVSDESKNVLGLPGSVSFFVENGTVEELK